MNISFKTQKTAKVLNSEKELVKKYGKNHARKIMKRLSVLRAAKNLSEVSHMKPERRHALTGKRKYQFAVDTLDQHRLTFELDHEMESIKDNNEINLSKVTSIIIIDVEDYH